MSIWSIAMLLFHCGVMCDLNINNFLYLHSNATYFLTKPPQSLAMKLITINQSDNIHFAVRVGSLDLHSFKISIKSNKYKVLLFPQLMSPFLSALPKEIEMKLLCKFFYPVAASGRNGLHQCWISYRGKSLSEINVGSCRLQLLATSCFCIVTATVSGDLLERSTEVVFKASVTYCPESTCANQSSQPSLEYLASSKLRIQLDNMDKLVWMRSFYNDTFHIGLLIGLPRMSLDKQAIFELPVAMAPSVTNRRITTLLIVVKFNKVLILDRIDKSEFMKTIHTTTSEENSDVILEINLETTENFRKDSIKSLERLFLLKFDLKFMSHLIQISVIIDEVTFEDNRDVPIMFNHKKNATVFSIPIAAMENIFIIPVVETIPSISRLARYNEPYVLNKDEFKIYYPYGGNPIDVTDKMECQSFNDSILKCPSFLKPIPHPVSKLIYNKESLEWMVKLKMEDLQVIVDVEPQIITGDSWEISIEDHVLNRIQGWRGPDRRSDTALIFDTRCESLYQLIPIRIFRNVTLYNPSTLEKMSMMIDVTNHIDLKYVVVSPKIAVIYRYGSHLIIQGIREGNMVLELRDSDGRLLSSKDLKVLDRNVSVQDIIVSCISDVSISSNSSNFSFLINIHDVKFNFKPFNKSQNCLLTVDLIYSDNSRANIVTFPMEQFSMRFNTNKEIFEVTDSTSMFYNYNKFNKETSFYIEIYESKACLRPQLIFKKLINLDPVSSVVRVSQNPFNKATRPMSTTNTITITGKSESTEGELGLLSSISYVKIIYILCGIFAMGLVVLILKLVKDFVVRKKYNNIVARRRNSCLNDKIGLPDKSHFENDYPPLLPSPGPQVGIVDNGAVTLSSPQSFWCLNPDNTLPNKKSQSFIRQFSLPVKGCPLKEEHNHGQPCPPLRWIQQLMPEDSKMNIYNSDEALDKSPLPMQVIGSPMTWSITQMEEDHSSGIGSLMTNMDDFLKDPYEAKDRFSKLSELPCVLVNKRETVYEAI